MTLNQCRVRDIVIRVFDEDFRDVIQNVEKDERRYNISRFN